MGLREISRTVIQAQRDQFFANREKSRYDDHTEQHETPHERSEQHGGHLQDAERLSGAEPADAADAGGTSGQVAELRREYLKKHRRVLYTNLKTSGKLTEHLTEIEQTAQRMVEQTVAQMAQTEGVTEELKATDPLRWTGLMNNLKHSAEELVMNDLIYS